ncbi:MAG: hypothetical protein ACRDGR_03120 [bacterium]
MIETHPSPDQALSDGFQQIDLETFGELVRALGLVERVPAKGGTA